MDVDPLFFENRTPVEEERDRRQMDLYLDSYDYYGPQFYTPRSDRSYASMRIFHTNGQSPEPLVEGDEWELLITKCYHNSNESKTRDLRRKFHYSVRPLRRIEEITQECNFGKKEICTTRRCGINRKIEKIPCTIRRKKYHTSTSGEFIVEVEEVFIGDVSQGFFHILSFDSIESIIREKRRLLGRHFDPKGQGRLLREFPLAPESLLTQLAHSAV